MTAPGTRVWLERQVAEYSGLLPVYERYAGVVADALSTAAGVHAPLAIVQTRTKGVPSFAEKSLSKSRKYAMPAHQLTDLCGARLIARTASEVRRVSRFVEDRFDVDWENSDDVSRRLSWSEFGYRSVHYVVSLRRGSELGGIDDDLYGFTCGAPECPGSGTFHPLKAEVQVRTLAEHAWADFAHDLTYKGAFPLPDDLRREIALMAADLEDVDRTATRIEDGLRTYAASYGTFLDSEQLAGEIESLRMVLEFEPDNPELAWRIGKLAMAAGDWDTAVSVMEGFVDADRLDAAPQPILRDLGVSLGKQGQTALARAHLEAAKRKDPTDSDAIASLAGTYRGEDDDTARDLYLRAFEADSTDYYPLLNYVDCEIQRTGTTDVLAPLGPMAERAIARCRAHIAVGVNIPWSLSSMAKFELFLGDPYAALDWYSLAIRAATADFMMPSLAVTRRVADRIDGHEWSDRLLTLARAVLVSDPEARNAIAEMATVGAPPVVGPVVMVTGDTAESRAAWVSVFEPLLAEALGGFRGTVISGGTRQGVCGLVGASGEAAGERIHTIGYLPGSLPQTGTPDDRYDELRTTSGVDFSPLEPLQAWIDIVTSGIDPSNVVVIGSGGGRIAAAEYRIALGLGARVGVVAGSGREASRLIADPRWEDAADLVALQADPHAVREFVVDGTVGAAGGE